MTPAAMLTTTADPTARAGITTEFDLVARMAPHVTAAQVAEELRSLAPALDALRPTGDGRGFIPHVQPYREFAVGDVRRALLVLLAAVGLVLAIACANVSSLLLVRGEARRSEFAVRAALGAGRARLVRQVLTEGLVLGLAATALAVVATRGLLPALLRSIPDGLPLADSVAVDARVVVIGLVLAIVSAILAALLPAVTSVGRQLAANLRDASRGTVASGGRWRRALVVAQVVLAVVGLAGAGLLIGSFRELRAEASRLASDQLVFVPLDLPPATYGDRARRLRLVTDLAEALEVDPHVAGATPINVTPFSGVGWDVPVFTAEGQSDAAARGNPPLNLEEVHPRYFSTFQVPLLRGRAFTAADTDNAPPVAIVSADVAARTWPGLDPIGRRLKMGPSTSPGRWWTVVGVTAPSRYRDLHSERSTLYVPARQMVGAAQQLAVRTSMPMAVLMELVRTRARSLDPTVTVQPLRAFTELLEVPLARPRFYTVLMATFGATGMALAVVGLYGVIAASVRQRQRVRCPQHSVPGRDLRWLVMAEGPGSSAREWASPWRRWPPRPCAACSTSSSPSIGVAGSCRGRHRHRLGVALVGPLWSAGAFSRRRCFAPSRRLVSAAGAALGTLAPAPGTRHLALAPGTPRGLSCLMPLFEYECQTCHHHFELLVRESTALECPACHGRDGEAVVGLRRERVVAGGATGGRTLRQLRPSGWPRLLHVH